MDYEISDRTSRLVLQSPQQQFGDPNNNNNNGGFSARSGANNDNNVVSTWPRKNKITDFFQVSRAPQKQQRLEKKRDFLYLAAEESVTTEDLLRAGGRAKVTVNDQEVALVAHNNEIFAMEPKCPHMQGPLHLGEIEEIPGCGPCIKCPWHSWTFSLRSGRCIAPQNHSETKSLTTFPVRVEPFDREIKIGFTEFSPKTFTTLPD